MMDKKVCTKCNLEKEILFFRKTKAYKNGIYSWCKSCENEYQKNSANVKKNQARYRKKTKEKRRQYNRNLEAKIKTLPKPELKEKKCSTCKTIKSIEFFNKRDHIKTGYNYSCVDCKRQKARKCYHNSDKNLKKRDSANYKANKKQRTPKWADKKKISEIYKNCPKGYHVDHIIPLQGDIVCGLHVENNLQYLTPKENQSKSNKLIIKEYRYE